MDTRPWSGDFVDGEVWGRGALDMKGHVAAAAVAFASLAREGIRPPGDVLLALTADEEVGGLLARARAPRRRTPFGLNEGGGDRCVVGGHTYCQCAVAAKATAPFGLRLRDRSGHASDPHAADNAVLEAGPVLDALFRPEPPRSLIPEVSVRSSGEQQPDRLRGHADCRRGGRACAAPGRVLVRMRPAPVLPLER